jgi:hypothetical protein
LYQFELMKKIVFVFIASFVLALALFLAVQYYLSVNAQRGALQVTSAPDSKVYLNNEYLGQTPLCKCEAADMLAAGEYTIRLVPLDSSLREFQEKVTISPAVLTVVDRKFGKNALSEGSIISLTPLSDKEKTELLVASFPQGSEVLLDDTVIGITPLHHKDPTESDHVLKIRKEGYNDKEVRIRTPRGYKLTVTAYLSTSATTQPASGSASQSPEGATPTPTPEQQRVTILETPTGFLRVRATPATTGAEVGRVSPGQTYPLSNEQAGWYEITLEDGTKGWISSDYASK